MLTSDQRKALRARGHRLKPVVLLGHNGLTDAVLAEIEAALLHHELIKVRLPATEREARAEILERIVSHTLAETIQTIGHIALLYRARPEAQREVP